MRRALLPLLALAGALAPAADAQCFGPDNLTAPCWEPVDLKLPDLPNISMPSAGICWSFCDPGVKDGARITMSAPVEVVCGQFRANLRVATSAGVGVLAGDATLDYTRTWREITPAGDEYQVWRFVTKIDFGREPGAPPVCWNPPSVSPGGFDTDFWYGYIDYAENCTTGLMENAVVLFKNCDDFAHNPLLSDRPAPAGGFHPTSMFAIVGPETAANPFNPGAMPIPISGGLTAEAVRNVPELPGTQCLAEERVQAGALQLLGTSCLCPIIPSTVQNASRLTGAGTCPDPAGVPSTFNSLSIFNPALGFKWFELMGTSLGTWTTNASYPGQEAPFAEEGFFVYHDSCAANDGLPADTLDIFYGAATKGGWNVAPVGQFGTELTKNFLDLASNYSEPGVVLPMLGSVQETDHLIYVNVP